MHRQMRASRVNKCATDVTCNLVILGDRLMAYLSQLIRKSTYTVLTDAVIA